MKTLTIESFVCSQTFRHVGSSSICSFAATVRNDLTRQIHCPLHRQTIDWNKWQYCQKKLNEKIGIVNLTFVDNKSRVHCFLQNRNKTNNKWIRKYHFDVINKSKKFENYFSHSYVTRIVRGLGESKHCCSKRMRRKSNKFQFLMHFKYLHFFICVHIIFGLLFISFDVLESESFNQTYNSSLWREV